MNKTSTVVLLNGVGSVGKTSIAKALQAMTAEPFLHVQMDAFLEMLPERYQDHAETFSYLNIEEDGQAVVAIESGPVGIRLMCGMRRAIAVMAAEGNNLIVDDVMWGDVAADYAKLLAAFRVYWVGVHAPLDVLEARERERGDRSIGLARWQFSRVHLDIRYDLEVDTSLASPAECATQIQQRFQL